MYTAIVFDFYDVMRSGGKIDADMIELIDALHVKYKIGLLTNASADGMAEMLRTHQLEKHFDVVVTSGGTGFIKPDAEIFEFILAKLGAQPAEAIFIDDNERNVHGAERVGMKGILYADLSELKSSLLKLKVEF